MSKKRFPNFPAFPVAPFSGDGHIPAYKGNTGIGCHELATLVMLHALVVANPEDHPSELVKRAMILSESFIESIFHEK